MFNSLRSLELSRTDWKIKTRVMGMWASFASNFEFIGMNMILLDTEDFHVHAFVISEAWDSLDVSVFEGTTYIIENFITRRARGYLRPVTSNIDIILNESSSVTPVPLELGRIPRHKFEITELGDIYSIVSNLAPGEDSTYALDIIGAIEQFHKSKKIPTKIGERDVVRFIITDGSISHNVTVWGEFASAVSSNYYKTELEQPVIGIIASSKIGMFREFVQIGTLPSTRIYFNLDVEPVNELRNRLKEEGYNPSRGFALAVNDIVPVLEHVSFASLIGNADSILDKVFVLVTFIVKKIEEADGWWFHSCTVCHEEVVKVERKFKCEACNRSFPYSEKKTPADNLINEMYKMIVGKEICAKIVLTQGNKSGDSNLYEAVDLFDQKFHDAGHGDKSPGSSVASFNQSSVVHGIELFQTPGSSGSVSKKIKKEEDVDVVHVE
ncbi:hypothetical protein ACET3Z_031703 [Daucus carota]